MQEEVILVAGRNALSKLVESRPSGKVVLDLSDVKYVASEDLGSLVVLHKRLKAEGGELVISNPSPGVKEVIEVTKLDTIFTMV